MRFLYFFLVIIYFFTPQLIAVPTALEIAEYGNKAVENRLKMKSWHVRVQHKNFFLNRPEISNKDITVEYYVDGIKNRVDQTFPYEKQIEGREKTFTHITSRDDKNQYSYSTEVLEDGTPVALSVIPLNHPLPRYKDKVHELEHQAMTRVADIRVLGFLSTGMIVTPPNFMVFIHHCEDRSDLKMEDDEIDGIKCKKISFVYRNPDNVSEIMRYHRFWIDPEQGYSILRSEGEPGDHSFLDRTDVTVMKHEKTSLWVPIKSVFERTAEKDGKKFIKRAEYLTLEYLSLNEDIPEETFTPVTMNIPVGRTAHVIPAPKEPDVLGWEKNNR
jgi:hypothetical protein